MNRSILNLKRVSLILLLCFVGAAAYAIEAEKKADDIGKKEEETKPKVTQAVSKGDVKELSQKPVAEVLVIASRLPSALKKINEVPSNISYIDKEKLEAMQPSTFQDSVESLEGVVISDQVGNGIDRSFGLRGFSQGNAVVTLVDGVQVNELDGGAVTYPLIWMSDVESIQVERGSTSPIYGSGAFAGVVNIMTRKPSRKPIHLFGGLELSSFKGIKFNQGIDGSIQDKVTPLGGRFTYYFNGGRDLNQGFRDNGEWRITNFDIKTGYELPNNNGGIRFGIKHIRDAISNPGELTLAKFQDNPHNALKLLDGRKMENTIIQIGADKKFWDDRISTSIQNNWRFNKMDFFTTSAAFPNYTYGFDPDTNLVMTKSRATDLIWQLGYQDTWKWIKNESQIGMELRNAFEHDLQQSAPGGQIFEGINAKAHRTAKPNELALFWRETLTFFNRIIAYAGMRHEWDRLKVNNDLTQPAEILTKHWSASTVSTGVTIKPVKFMDIFGNYSQGFRVPSISDINPYGSTTYTNLSPEKANSYEVGTRMRYNKKAEAKMSYFLIDTKDEIVFDNTSKTAQNPYGSSANVGRTRRTGIETRLDIAPISEITAYGSYAWTQAYITKSVADPANSFSPFDGRSLGLVPKHRFTLGGTITPFKRFGKPYDGFDLSLNGVFTGDQKIQSYESTGNNSSGQDLLNLVGGNIKRYFVWNFMTSFKWKGTKIYFKINNLFGEKYFSRAIATESFGTAILPAGNYLMVTPGAPREYLLGMTWEFGE